MVGDTEVGALLRLLTQGSGPVLMQERSRLNCSTSGDRSELAILVTAVPRASVSYRPQTLACLEQDGEHVIGWEAGPLWWAMLASHECPTVQVYATKVAT